MNLWWQNGKPVWVDGHPQSCADCPCFNCVNILTCTNRTLNLSIPAGAIAASCINDIYGHSSSVSRSFDAFSGALTQRQTGGIYYNEWISDDYFNFTSMATFYPSPNCSGTPDGPYSTSSSERIVIGCSVAVNPSIWYLSINGAKIASEIIGTLAIAGDCPIGIYSDGSEVSVP